MIQDKKALLLKLLQHLGAVAFFLLATVIYFSPQMIDNKTLHQHDVSQFKGASEDLRAYYDDEGESSAWTGGMFSGMPAYQIGVWGGSPNMLNYVEAPLKALGGSTAGPVFTGMLMAYILFILMGCNIPLAMFGAIAYSLSTYNIIILDAGHVTKAWTLAYMPIVVAGMLSLFKNKYLTGGLCMALGLAMMIKSNHLQMTYYTAILCAILFVTLVVVKIKNKEIPALLKSSGVLAFAVVIALLANAGSLYSNYEMSRESTRGKSELTSTTGTGTSENTSGLDKEYVFHWSYGKAETLSLMIPNINGGGSLTWLDSSSNLHQELVKQGMGAQLDKRGVQSYTYWGDQPGTSGPVYFGAAICMLFLLGMLIIRNPMKWVLFGATVFFVFLAWGKNFELLNDLFYNFFPLYGKFRAVSQALVVPALLMIIMAVWGIKEFMDGGVEKEQLKKSLYLAVGITGGICLFLALMPDFFFNFTSANDAAWKDQMPEWFYKMTLLDRKDMLRSDAFRSLVFIVLSGAILLYTVTKSVSTKTKTALTFALALLLLVDLWGVDKRFLGSDRFVDKQAEAIFPKTPADEMILQDKDLSYRVFTLNNPFAETSISYYHKSIGGYHAAKLQRYQQLIENKLQPEMMNIYQSFQTQDIDSITSAFEKNIGLNMLNTRYIVHDPKQPPLMNPYAYGNAWFVTNYRFVDNADAEMDALKNLAPNKQAVIDKQFEAELSGFSVKADSTASITLTGYKPNKLSYKTKANSDQLAIFSEVYYENGWNAYVDGQPAPHFRSDWILRSMIVPAGEHEIVFKFEPKSYELSKTIATASSATLVLLLIGTIIWLLTRKEEETE